MRHGMPIARSVEDVTATFALPRLSAEELEADVLYQLSALAGLLRVSGGGMHHVKAHGALYLHLKTEGELQARIARLRWPLFFAFLVVYVGVTIATLVLVPHATRNFDRFPIAWVVVVLNGLAVANVSRAIHHGKPGQTFASSCGLVAALVFLFGMAMFPKLAISSLHPAHDLDAWNAASSESTLGLMRWIAFLGMPFVITYTAIVYWVFRGKTKLDDFSY